MLVSSSTFVNECDFDRQRLLLENDSRHDSVNLGYLGSSSRFVNEYDFR